MITASVDDLCTPDSSSVLVGHALSVLVGHAFMFHDDGNVLLAAHAPVMVFANTQVARHAIAIIQSGNLPSSALRQAMLADSRPACCVISQCDNRGVFRFDELRPLDCIVAIELRWKTTHATHSGTLISSINLKPGLNRLVVNNLP